jgi:ornithine cyclodeaminase/alanine dehydrogenase-like protein (mu-crystallin family)
MNCSLNNPEDYYEYAKNTLLCIAAGKLSIELPPKQLFCDEDPASDFRIMPCIIKGKTNTRKTVKIVGTNIRQQLAPDQITVGKAFNMHPQENFISHIFDACILSSARTGICATLAAYRVSFHCASDGSAVLLPSRKNWLYLSHES